MTQKMANTQYIFYYLNSQQAYKQIINFSLGSTIHRINLADICRILVPVPGIEVQQHIAAILSTLDQKLAAEQSRKEALDTLFTSLLHDLMTAKIRVAPAETA
jgi:type I restriction enzyme S subunit